jgi:hypothetical protein
MARRIVAMLTPLACLAMLAGCGDSEISRGTTGAGIGAGAGAAVCAVTIIGIIPCAIAGGALGAAGGVATAGPDEPSSVAATAAPPAAPPAQDLYSPTPLAPGEPVGTPQPPGRVTAEPLN